MHACKNVDVPAVDDGNSMDYGDSMAENEDNEDQVDAPLPGSAIGDVDLSH